MSEDGPGELFQRETKHRRDRLVGREMDWNRRPETYKRYPDRPSLPLPEPQAPQATLDQVLRERESLRVFADRPIKLEELSYLLWASTGITRRHRGYELRTAPSAGALYPVETYVALNRVEGIAPAI